MNTDNLVTKKLQDTLLSMMQDIHSFCVANKITYYIVGGTCLGALRHKGFIPWDDDFDIAMPRKDYNRFIDLCISGAIGNKYHIQCSKTYSKYWLTFAKLRLNNSLFIDETVSDLDCHKGIFIDIFPLDITSSRGLLFHSRAKMIKIIKTLIFYKGSSLKTWKSQLARFIFFFVPIKVLSYLEEKIATSQSSGDCYVNYGSNYNYIKQTMPIDIYDPAILVDFNGNSFYAPAKTEDYLVRLYKNWKRLPPENMRRTHYPEIMQFPDGECYKFGKPQHVVSLKEQIKMIDKL